MGRRKRARKAFLPSGWVRSGRASLVRPGVEDISFRVLASGPYPENMWEAQHSYDSTSCWFQSPEFTC